MVMRPTDEWLLLLMLYIVPATVAGKQTTPKLDGFKTHLFHSPICNVDKAHQGQLIAAPLGIRWGGFRAGGCIIWILCSLTCLASELGGLKQLRVGATGHLFMLSHCMVTRLHLHESALGSQVICPLKEERGEMRKRRGSTHQADAMLPLTT